MLDRFEKFLFSITEISKYWHKIAAEEMKDFGLKGPYALYFTTMSRYSDGITAAKLGQLCNRDKSDVSKAISVLEQKGFVKKESNSANFYRASIVLTKNGKQLAEKINQKVALAVNFAGKDFSEQERKFFYDCLENIVTNLRTLSQTGLTKGV